MLNRGDYGNRLLTTYGTLNRQGGNGVSLWGGIVDGGRQPLSYKRLTDNTRASGARGGVYPLFTLVVSLFKGQCRNIWGDKLVKAVELLTLKRAFASYLGVGPCTKRFRTTWGTGAPQMRTIKYGTIVL